jgi:hypothetical protein
MRRPDAQTVVATGDRLQGIRVGKERRSGGEVVEEREN